MAETVRMPKLGFDMAEGTLVRWVKKEGETVNKGEVLAEIETDKATVEVESSASGVVRKLLVDEGAVVPINTPIALVGTADEKLDELPPVPVQTSKVESQSVPAPDQKSTPGQQSIVEAQSAINNQQSAILNPLWVYKQVLHRFFRTGQGCSLRVAHSLLDLKSDFSSDGLFLLIRENSFFLEKISEALNRI